MGSNTSIPVPKQIYLAAKAGNLTELRGLRDRLRPHLGPGNQVAPERRAEILEWADDDGRTALVVAAAKDHKGIVELLLKLGANAHHVDRKKDGGSALHVAVQKKSSHHTVELLLRHGANPFVENTSGFTALDYAILRKDTVLVRRFEEFGRFRGHLRAKVPSWGGLGKSWQPRWAAIVPRYSYPRLPRSEHVTRHLLLFYENASHCEPTCRMYLSGSHITLAANDKQDIDRVCTVTLHPTQPMPRGLVTKGGEGGAGFSIFLKRCPASGRGNANRFPPLERFVSAARFPQHMAPPSQTDEQLAQQLHALLNPDAAVPVPHTSNSSTSTYPMINPSGHMQTQAPTVQSPAIKSSTAQTTTPMPAGSSVPSAPPLPEPYSPPVQPVPTPAQQKVEEKPATVPAVADNGIDDEDDDDDDTCVICLAAPKEAGFVHGDSVHRCVCKECAAEVMQQEPRSCPICRQKIETVLTGFY